MLATLVKASTFGVTLGLAAFVGMTANAQDRGTIVVEGHIDKSNRKVCKTSAPPTGTRLGQRRICRTAAEWKMIEQRSQELVERGQQRQRAMEAYNQNAKNALANQGPP